MKEDCRMNVDRLECMEMQWMVLRYKMKSVRHGRTGLHYLDIHACEK